MRLGDPPEGEGPGRKPVPAQVSIEEAESLELRASGSLRSGFDAIATTLSTFDVEDSRGGKRGRQAETPHGRSKEGRLDRVMHGHRGVPAWVEDLGVPTVTLMSCNAIMLLFALTLLLGQTFSDVNMFQISAELMVLGLGIALMAALAFLGIKATLTRSIEMLRVYSFMVILVVILQISIVAVIVRNEDSSMTDSVLEMAISLCRGGK